MSTISAIGSNSGACGPASGPGRTRESLFAKVDADGSGGIDKTELQGLLDKVAGHSGAAASSADELGKGMKSQMPAPTRSTPTETAPVRPRNALPANSPK